MNPRKPTKQELQELIAYEIQQEEPTEEELEEEKETVEGWVENAGVSVFDGYNTESPGYSGKVMVVVWPGSPAMTSTYIWEQKKVVMVAGTRFNRKELQIISGAFYYALLYQPDNKGFRSIMKKVQALLNGEEFA